MTSHVIAVGCRARHARGMSTPSERIDARPATAHEQHTVDHARSRPLRRALRLNAVSSGMTGLALAIAPGTVDDLLGTGRSATVRLVGLALVGFALAVAVLSTRSERTLRREVPGVIALDIAWVLTSVATIPAGWFEPGGAIAVAMVAVVVATWATLQWRGLSPVRVTETPAQVS